MTLTEFSFYILRCCGGGSITYLLCRVFVAYLLCQHAGVYADPESLRQELGDKYGSTDPEKLKTMEEFFEDVMENDVELSVRLVIVYGHLKIGSMRSAFEDSVGGQIKKFSGGTNTDLLARSLSMHSNSLLVLVVTSQF